MSEASATVVSGQSARKAAAVFNYGNIISLILPFPLMIFWLGASMFVYALNRHHPNDKVGHYTQQAAYRYYAITGFFVAVAMFIPVEIMYYAIAWAIAAVIIIPWSILDLKRIRNDCWEDTIIEGTPA